MGHRNDLGWEGGCAPGAFNYSTSIRPFDRHGPVKGAVPMLGGRRRKVSASSYIDALDSFISPVFAGESPL
jgi:hypothetical protein